MYKPDIAIKAGIVTMAIALGSPAIAAPGEPFEELQELLLQMQEQIAQLQEEITTLKEDVSDIPTDVDLRGVRQNWDKTLDSTNGEANGCNSERFTCLFGDMAVRDSETGLVWERSPDAVSRVWVDAIDHCADLELGGRKGWALPTREELASLVEDANGPPLALPTGHPFVGIVANETYLTATTDVGDPTKAGAILFSNGSVGSEAKIGADQSWCVRGGNSFDGNTQ